LNFAKTIDHSQLLRAPTRSHIKWLGTTSRNLWPHRISASADRSPRTPPTSIDWRLALPRHMAHLGSFVAPERLVLVDGKEVRGYPAPHFYWNYRMAYYVRKRQSFIASIIFGRPCHRGNSLSPSTIASRRLNPRSGSEVKRTFFTAGFATGPRDVPCG